MLPLVRPGGRFASTLIMSPQQIPSEMVTVKAVYAVPTAELLSGLAAAVSAGRLRVPIERTYPLDEVPAPLRDFAQQGTLGKLAIVIR